ncbi:MAG: thiamine pyrophosphate-binding protein [Chloroflexi bacterium]|nr:MAG: thiamine pyrophosphate-binding protein [Chloroflexota bacterium]MBL1196436.1 thiamine pyrophosphate-binding protein [Chloroflexota bacterium]NOH13731.1 thiamine pyrophosphate-binding protein [Chloroflexota bacterium]
MATEYKHTGFALAKMLMDYGVEYIFGIPGGQTLPLYDASYAHSKQLKHISVRDERHAGHAACVYSRVSGKLGVCDATVGPGVTNLPSALGEALNSSTPFLAIAGEHPVGWANKIDFGRASQGIDQISMLKPVSKKVIYVPTQDSLPELVKTAFLEATTGRPGPVVLVIPADVFKHEGGPQEIENYIEPGLNHYPTYRTAPDPEAITKAATLLRDAKSPVMLVGGGTLLSGAMEEAQKVAEYLSMPVVSTITGKGTLAYEHELNMGTVGIFANAHCADPTLREADLVFMVGTKNSQSSTFLWTVPTPEQKVIHLDVDPGEIGRIFRTDVGLAGDAKLGLEALYQELKAGGEIPVNAKRIEKLTELKAAWQAKKEELYARDNTPIQPYRVMDAVNKTLGPDDYLACDAGFASGWGALYFEQKSAGRRSLFPRGLAGLGFSVAAGIGAQLAAPDSRVVTIAGDAGFSYDMAELTVQAQLGLPIVNIVLNNSAYGWVKWAEQAWYDGSFSASELQSVDFAKVAEGVGCVGVKVDEPAQIEPSLKEALKLNKPVVLDITIDDESTPNIPM